MIDLDNVEEHLTQHALFGFVEDSVFCLAFSSKTTNVVTSVGRFFGNPSLAVVVVVVVVVVVAVVVVRRRRQRTKKDPEKERRASYYHCSRDGCRDASVCASEADLGIC